MSPNHRRVLHDSGFLLVPDKRTHPLTIASRRLSRGDVYSSSCVRDHMRLPTGFVEFFRFARTIFRVVPVYFLSTLDRLKIKILQMLEICKRWRTETEFHRSKNFKTDPSGKYHFHRTIHILNVPTIKFQNLFKKYSTEYSTLNKNTDDIVIPRAFLIKFIVILNTSHKNTKDGYVSTDESTKKIKIKSKIKFQNFFKKTSY